MSSKYAAGRRWLCTPPGRARFWFVILGPGTNNVNKPSSAFKRCRIEVLPYDLHRHVPGYRGDKNEQTYSHAHLRKHAVLVDDTTCPDCLGTDEHPPEHCQDCAQLDHIPEGHPSGKGCIECGFTGYASDPPFDRTKHQTCSICRTKS